MGARVIGTMTRRQAAELARHKLRFRRRIPRGTRLELVCRRFGWRCEECGEEQNYRCYLEWETKHFTGDDDGEAAGRTESGTGDGVGGD